MKYWFYSEGNILGPYAPAELLSLPAFSQGSLVCPETCTGDNPGDWKAAEQVGEIAEAMSVGTGAIYQSGGLSGTYEQETGFSSNLAASYFETKKDQPYGYENLLNTIDNILGAYKESEAPAIAKPAPDYELMDRFDIRLSKIQEDLEAARWEKNLLMEKIRAKDTEERKNRERIAELEEQLKKALNKGDLQDKELSQVQHLSELSGKDETLKKIAELKKEDFVDRSARPEPARPESARPEPARPESAQPEPVRDESAPPLRANPVIESRTFKSMRPSQEISLERMPSAGGPEEKDDRSLTSRKLRSLGSNAPSFRVNKEEAQSGAPAEAAPQAAPEPMQPLPQQASGMVYDFTVMTKQPSESEKVQFKIESVGGPAPAPQPVPRQPSQAAAPQGPAFTQQPSQAAAPQGNWIPRPAPQPAQAQPPNAWETARTLARKAAAQKPDFVMPMQNQFEPTGAASLKTVPMRQPPAAAPGEAAPADKTERIPVPTQKQKDDVKKPAQPDKKGRNKMAFLAIMLIFGAIAAGGLGYFFLGSGSFAQFFGLNFKGDKSAKSTLSTQLEPQADKTLVKPSTAPAAEETAPEAQGPSAQGTTPAPEAKPAFEAATNENTGRALEIVKNYKLSGGRGSVAGWFANSFLSSSATGSNEEWSATILHGDIFVVQYRLLRPKQDPLIYQFEVDVAKSLIVRGINNNAIDLLDFSSKVTAKAAPAPKPKAKKARKPRKSGEIPILPLPDEPAAKPAQEEPTGFEAVTPEDNEKVKYIVAQESDEELF
jgi:flagellar basal body-associated protein FliL